MDPSTSLSEAVAYLTEHATPVELTYLARNYAESELLETWDELNILKLLLCRRDPTPALPPDILEIIDSVLLYERAQKVLTHSSNIPPLFVHTASSGNKTSISLWKGDITTIAHVTAIVNAANSELLGCFSPFHKCIDNAIHTAAGPRLREECFSLMTAQGTEEPVGRAKVTKGYCLPAEYVIHTVGPQVTKGEIPSGNDLVALVNCYLSSLEACEKLPAMKDGRKVLVFPCISTGIFGFPVKLAAESVVPAIEGWLSSHPDSTISEIIFDVFSDDDYEIYSSIFLSPPPTFSDQSPTSRIPPEIFSQPEIQPQGSSLALASTWLQNSSYLLITAGAGLTASAGLDYTSTSLFSKRFPAYTVPPYDFTCLLDLIRPLTWPSELARWGYYFNHFLMVRNWPASSVYRDLLTISNYVAPGKTHVRTSNVDGFFVKNGFKADTVSTPQGQYAYLQCATPCRATATFLAAPFIAAAIPFLDPETQMLTDESKIPLCSYCGGKLVICARMGDNFVEKPFRPQEAAYRSFRHNIVHPLPGSAEADYTMVILELGVGLSTPGVLRWPNENLVARGAGKVKLIRIGLEESGCVDWEDEDMVGIKGDIGDALKVLLKSLPSVKS